MVKDAFDDTELAAPHRDREKLKDLRDVQGLDDFWRDVPHVPVKLLGHELSINIGSTMNTRWTMLIDELEQREFCSHLSEFFFLFCWLQLKYIGEQGKKSKNIWEKK
jgi:hypothetical protein